MCACRFHYSPRCLMNRYAGARQPGQAVQMEAVVLPLLAHSAGVTSVQAEPQLQEQTRRQAGLLAQESRPRPARQVLQPV